MIMGPKLPAQVHFLLFTLLPPQGNADLLVLLPCMQAQGRRRCELGQGTLFVVNQ